MLDLQTVNSVFEIMSSRGDATVYDAIIETYRDSALLP